MPPSRHRRNWSSSVDIFHGGGPGLMPRSKDDTIGEESHGLLTNGAPSNSEKRRDEQSSSLRTRAMALLAIQGKPLIFLMVTWTVLMIYLLHPDSSREGSDLDITHTALNLRSRKRPAALHLIVPANKKDPNLCKLMISAGALGYPDPVIINWNKTFEIADKVEGGSHLAKITGINDYLQKIPENQDEDIVIMVDEYDAWLQLRPQTLVDRYFDLNKRADKRIAEELGPAAAQQNITQKIIFGTQKRCWPWTKDDPPCYAAPFSALPEKVYGPDIDTKTDAEDEDPKFPFLKFRPRYLNSGVMVGTVAPLRKLFSTAKHLMETNIAETNFGSAQYIFSHMFGDQEVWREAIRLDSRTPEQISKETTPGKYTPLHPFNPTHISEVRAKASNHPDNNYEFNIGLDTESLIGLNAVFAENDTDFLVWADKPSLHAAEAYVGVPPSPHHTHMDTLPEDITDTLPPFWTFNSEPKLPRWKTWSEIPLFTNIWTGIVPAVIHHNAHIDGPKNLRDTWWHLVWYQKFARILYDAHIYEPILPVAFSGYDEEGERGRKEYWPSERWRGGGRNSTMYDEGTFWVRFEDICTEYHEELFRDGKGPWVLPDVH